MIDIIETKAGIEAENEAYAQQVREFCREHHICLINLMASPGAGKTTLLCRTLDHFNGEYICGVLEADVDADVDARAVQQHGAIPLQIHTAGSCHMDARMTLDGLRHLLPRLLEARLEAARGTARDPSQREKHTSESSIFLVFLENVGNLVCPAEFDVGAFRKVMILSVPEGDDKPLKYPLMFQVSDCLLISKTDTAEIFDFSLDRCRENVLQLREEMPILPLSAKTEDGFDAWLEWLNEQICNFK